MAAPDAPCRRAGGQQGGAARKCCLKLRGKRGDGGFRQACRAGGAQIAGQHFRHGGRCVQPRHQGRRLMQCEKQVAQAIQKLWRQRATRRHCVQEITGRDRRHAEYPFHHLPIAVFL